MRIIISRLIISFLILLILPACDFQSKYFRKLDLAKLNRWGAPYQGFNLEMNFAGVDIGFFPEGGYGAGFELVDINMFYSLALGMYLHVGAPSYGGSNKDGHSALWTPSAGLIYQPVASWAIKPYIKVGGGGLMWNGDGSTRWTPIVEGAIGLATAFNYRASLDFYVARDMSPLAEQDPWVMAIRLNLIGFSLVSFKPEGKLHTPSDDMPGDM